MISDVWNKIKELARKMLPKKSIENVLHVNPVISDRMADAIQMWSDMYEGKCPWIKEPNAHDASRVVSLGLPSQIASEKARMVTLEMKSEITNPAESVDNVESNMGTENQPSFGSNNRSNTNNKKDDFNTRSGFLNSQYRKLLKQIRRQLEYGIAKGGLVIKPYIVMYDSTNNSTDAGEQSNRISYNKSLPKAEIEFDFVQADRFFPLAFDANGKVVEAAFIQTKVNKAEERVYIRLEYHKLVNRTVTVQNLAFESTDMSLSNSNNIKSATNLGKQIPLTSVPEWSSLSPTTVIENVDRLLFAYFRMPEANTVDPNSPLGVSGYSRVVQLIKDADMQYSRLLWEFEAGEMAIDVDRDALRFVTSSAKDGGEGYSVLPDKQNRLFRKIDLNAEDTYNVFAPSLRDASIVHGLNTILMKIEDATGLSRGTISEVNEQEAKTATELKILKQRSYATNRDIQAALEDALRDAVYVMDVYCTLYAVTPDGDYDISFEWDDSIIVDSESELSKRITLMQNGLASKVETRMWYYGETENQAMAALAKVDEEAQQTAMRNAEAEAMKTSMMKDPSDTTDKKISTGKQADDLDNPDKSKTTDQIKGKQ